MLNAFYRALADRFKAVANAISAEASRLRVQAKALRDAAGIEGEQAQAREAEATALLAEATEAREEATGLRTEGDAFIARAQAAEALAAEYRALAEHPPSAQIATHYLYDPAGRLLGEYDDDAGQVEREYVYLEGMLLALIAPNGIYYYHTDHLGTPESLNGPRPGHRLAGPPRSLRAGQRDDPGGGKQPAVPGAVLRCRNGITLQLLPGLRSEPRTVCAE